MLYTLSGPFCLKTDKFQTNNMLNLTFCKQNERGINHLLISFCKLNTYMTGGYRNLLWKSNINKLLYIYLCLLFLQSWWGFLACSFNCGDSAICLSSQPNKALSRDGKQCSATVPKAERIWSNCGSSPLCSVLFGGFSCELLINHLILTSQQFHTLEYF